MMQGYRPLPGVSAELLRERNLNAASLEWFFDRQWSGVIDHGLLAGAVVAVVRDGAVLFQRGYGHADIAGRRSVDAAGTPFRLASISKLVTATAVMQLVESGMLGLDDEVNQHLDFRIPPTFEEPVRIRHLLTHTAGFETQRFGFFLGAERDCERTPRRWLQSNMPARVRPPATDFGDGRAAAYSDWGFALAGHIIALKSGLSFEDYTEARIFQPCGMSTSTFREMPLPPDMATGYDYRDQALRSCAVEYFGAIGPAASLSATAADMARFMIAHLQFGLCANGNRIINEETARTMQSRVLSPHPRVNGFGLGFFETAMNGLRTVGHSGKSVYMRSDLVLIPEKRLGLFLAFNSVPPERLGNTVERFFDYYFESRVPRLDAPAGFAARAAQYTGSFGPLCRSFTTPEALFGLMSDTHTVTATERGALVYKSVEWVETEPDVFRRAQGQEVIAFLRDGKGSVSHLIGPNAVFPHGKLSRHETAVFTMLSFWSALLEKRRELGWSAGGSWWIGLLAMLLPVAVATPFVDAALRSHPLPSLLTVSIALVNALIVAALLRTAAVLHSDFRRLLAGIPWYFAALRWLSAIALMLTTSLLCITCAALYAGQWTLLVCLEYATVAVMAATFVVWLRRWRLL